MIATFTQYVLINVTAIQRAFISRNFIRMLLLVNVQYASTKRLC